MGINDDLEKFAFSVLSLIIMGGTAIVGAKVPAFAPLFPTLVGGIVAISGIFITGKVAHAYVDSKAIKGNPDPDEDPKKA